MARTRLAESHDFATVASNHTFVMNHPETCRLILNFLRSGRFAEH
ncbi:hypothetical protein [Chitinimonas lacunae]|uniref:Alpha/beta hydrolase n=1 Tax=Chitinimonas lacunae TaxID=1963018 RepID=A0ABV8MT03_9NEIS